MTIGIIIFLPCDLKERDYYNRIGPKRLLLKYGQDVEKSWVATVNLVLGLLTIGYFDGARPHPFRMG
jgi:hypothetical protein